MDVRGDERPSDDDTELPLEAAEADAAEQHRALRETDEEPRREVPLDVDPADAAEQDRLAADDDDDDYR
ncbi:hypothetical protein [Nonomuraea soli]|uniref:DUF5709 domain-containing protein n=1 Tax=Nonomuraea soli TaxID=1032476 RepID=A0A7W0HUD5_9ACTN|nr:hypothetical protein [Nonomuraea soli]MBA2895852.1 hypothetical protein [Nonomuraea soli]